MLLAHHSVLYHALESQRPMRVLTIVGTLLLTPGVLARSDAQKPVPNLELRLLPRERINGIPRAFTFELINVTHHNVWVAEPAVQCDDSFDGTLSLRMKFIPLHPPGSETGGGCAADRFNYPPILERSQEWKLLPPGERLEKTASLADLHYESGQSGSYEFWAEYFPADVQPADQQALRDRGIDFPIEKLTTSHLKFTTGR